MNSQPGKREHRPVEGVEVTCFVQVFLRRSVELIRVFYSVFQVSSDKKIIKIPPKLLNSNHHPIFIFQQTDWSKPGWEIETH